MKLQILQCPQHKYHAIAIEDGDERGGTRLTSGKCCGSWSIVRSWKIDDDMADEIIKFCKQAKKENKKDRESKVQELTEN